MSADDSNFVSEKQLEKPDTKKRSRDNLNSDRSVTHSEVSAAAGLNPNRSSGSASEKPAPDDASLQIVDAISGEIIAERPKDKGKRSFAQDSRTRMQEHVGSDSVEDTLVRRSAEHNRDGVSANLPITPTGILESFAGGSHAAISPMEVQLNDRDPSSFRSYLDGTLDHKMIESLSDTKLSSEEIAKIRKEVNKHGMDPQRAILDAMKHNRVLIIGETHTTIPEHNSIRLLGPKLIPDLVKNGATHFALEIDIRFQPYLDEFQKTSAISDQFKEEFTKQAPLLASDDYYALLRSANQAGLKLVAVDKPRPDLPPQPPHEAGQPPQPLPVEYILASRGRDEHMAKEIGEVLKDPDAKVVFWAGKKHGEDPAGNYNIAIEVLRDHGHTVASVRPEESRFPKDTLTRLLPDLRKAVAIPTSKTSALASLPTDSRFLSFVEHYGDWDIVIAFPDPYKIDSRATGL